MLKGLFYLKAVIRVLKFALYILLTLNSAAWSQTWERVADIKAQRLDPARKAWVAVVAQAAYAKVKDQVMVRVPGVVAGSRVQLRVAFADEPEYKQWKRDEAANGGLRWQAVKALIDQAGEGPVIFQSQGAWPKRGSAKIEIGVLSKGSRRFERYLVAQGTVQGDRFVTESLVFDSALASGAWSVMAPWIRQRLLDKH